MLKKKDLKIEKKEIFPFNPSLIKKKYRTIAIDYYDFVARTKNMADSLKISNVSKVKNLCEIEDIFFFQKENKSSSCDYVVNIREKFTKELLAPRLVTDVISALKKDATNAKFEIWPELMNYYDNYAGTMGRFLLALYDENPSTYLPASSLCIAHQMLLNLTSLKHDLKTSGKLYISEDLLDEFKVRRKDFQLGEMSDNVKNLIKFMLEKIKGLLKDSNILCSIVKDTGLRIQFATLMSKSYILYRKVKKNDVLSKEIRLSKFDKINAALTGNIEGLLTVHKELKVKKNKKVKKKKVKK